MARGDYTPEIRTSLGDSPVGRLNKSPPRPSMSDSAAEVAADTKAGIKQNSAADIKQDAAQARGAPQAPPPPHMQGIPADAHHVAAATSIAHAILNHRGGGGY